MNVTEPWPPDPLGKMNLLEQLQEQMECLHATRRNVPREFAGTATSCSRLYRLLRREMGFEVLSSSPIRGYQSLDIFGIPVVEDEDVPDGEIRIRYVDGREEVFKLP